MLRFFPQLLRLSYLTLSKSIDFTKGKHYSYICLDTRLRFSVPCCGTEVSLLVSRRIHFVNCGSQTCEALHNCCSRCSATVLLLDFGRLFMAADSKSYTTSLGSGTFRGVRFTKRKNPCGYVRRRGRVNGHWRIENVKAGRVIPITISSR